MPLDRLFKLQNKRLKTEFYLKKKKSFWNHSTVLQYTSEKKSMTPKNPDPLYF